MELAGEVEMEVEAGAEGERRRHLGEGRHGSEKVSVGSCKWCGVGWGVRLGWEVGWEVELGRGGR